MVFIEFASLLYYLLFQHIYNKLDIYSACTLSYALVQLCMRVCM